MGATGLIAAGGLLVQAVSSSASAYGQSEAQKLQGAYQQKIASNNAELATLQSDDAIRRGEQSATNINTKARVIVGAQRAGFASQGVDVNSGSAADVQADTAAMSAADARTVRINAMREAWGYKVQALDATSRGQMAAFSADNESRNTLLTGGLKTIGYGFKAGTTFKGFGPSSNTDTSASGGTTMTGESYDEFSNLA